MYLKCLIDHTYQEVHFKAGEVYEVEDFSASRLLRDYGPDSSVETRRNRSPKFEATTERPTEPDKPEGGEENVIDNELPEEGEGEPEADATSTDDGNGLCNYPVGSGTCVLAEGHAGAHRLTPPDEVRR